MFFQTKKPGKYECLRLVENQRVDGKDRQTFLPTVGRLDRLNRSGAIDCVVRPAARFGGNPMILPVAKEEAEEHPGAVVQIIGIGPALVVERR